MFDKKSSLAISEFLLRAHQKGQLMQLSISDISKHTRLSRPTVHQVLSEFESFGMLTYQTSASDNRFKHVILTDQFINEIKRRFAVFNTAAFASTIASQPITPPDPIRAPTPSDLPKP
jgi:DNA-binding MarR family transcriptional regulator